MTHRGLHRAGWVLLGLAGLLVLFTFRDYGIAWDAPSHVRYGELILAFFRSGFEDRRFLDLGVHAYYGGLFDLTAELLRGALPFTIHETRNLLSALAGLAAMAGTWRLGRYLGGEWAGLAALLLLALLPSFYGHMFINAKDTPFAAGYVWTLYFAVRAAEALPNVPTGRALLLALALGTTLAFRIGGVLLILDLGLLLLLHLAWRRGGRESVRFPLLLKNALWILIPAYLLMIAAWPLALLHPLAGPLKAMAVMSDFPHWVGTILFMGSHIPVLDLPPDYLPIYLSVKIPEFLLVLLVVALPLALWGTRRAVREGDRRMLFGYAALWLGAFFPPLFAIVRQMPHYDGIRHFLFILPPLAVLAGVETARAAAWLAQRRPALLIPAGTLLTSAMILTVADMIRLHPYQYVYYNALTGGLRGAEGRFELDYWAVSYKEAAEKLVDYARRDAIARGLTPEKQIYETHACEPATSAFPYLPENFRNAKGPDWPTFFIAITRWDCDEKIKARTVVDVTRLGVRLAVVKDLRFGFEPKL